MQAIHYIESTKNLLIVSNNAVNCEKMIGEH